MVYFVGVDVGGTFTDAFGMSDNGQVAAAKVLSTPSDYSEGITESLRMLALNFGLKDLRQLLNNVLFLMHGTTVSLNAVVSKNTPRVGFITTKGHRDAIYIMRMIGRYGGLSQDKTQDFIRTNKPAPIIPRQLAKEVTERLDYEGKVVVPLDVDESRDKIRQLLAEKVEGIAVSLLWSFRNPEHERKLKSIIQEENASMFVTLSSELIPRVGEYARSSTTVFNCLIGPILNNYLSNLRTSLQQKGLVGPILVMQGNGGVVEASVAPKYAVTTLGSVLVGGVAGASALGQMLGDKDIITTDVGGTTFLVGLIKDWRPVFTSSVYVNQYTLNVSMINVESIGSGGGSIAWMDKGSVLRVGPRSAGASPGPACYGLGGTEPTVTDAAVTLGIIDPKSFLGGRLVLDKSSAEKAIEEKIARPLGMKVKEAAMAIFEIQNSQTTNLLRNTTVEAGYDPRDFAIYVFGGAGPMHCFAYARDLGVKRILIPLNATASTFSAYGLASSDVIQSVEKSDPAIFPVDVERMNQNFSELEDTARKRLLEQRMNLPNYNFRREIDMKYRRQTNEISVPVRNGMLAENEPNVIIGEFKTMYELVCGKGTSMHGAPIECLNYRVFIEAALPSRPRLPLIQKSSGTSPAEALIQKRLAWFDSSGEKMASIFDSDKLKCGHEVQGPAIVQASTTTLVVPESAIAKIDAYGNAELSYL